MANEQNARIIWDWLKYDLGLDDLRTAAIMGNVSQESGFETGTESFDGEGSFGFAQWTYDRRTALEALGGDPANLDTQLQHFKNEISEGGARRYAWVNLLNNEGGLEALTNGWCDDFEAPSEKYANRQHRIDEAYRYLNMFGGEGRASYTGSVLGLLAPLHAEASHGIMYGDPTPERSDYDDGYDDAVEDVGTLRASAENFWDSITESGLARTLEYVWGGITHSGKMWYEKKDPVTQEDVDFVQQSLSGDKDAQRFVLLNGRDRQEIQWLVNQKLVEKNRKAMIDKWKEQNDGILAKIMVGGAGAAGYLIDPLNLVPMGGAVKSSMLIGRLGSALLNPAKASEIASIAARTGYELAKRSAPLSGSVLVNDYLKESFSGEKQNYAFDAAAAMLAGTVLSVAGYGLGKAFARGSMRNTLSDEVAAVADRAETTAYREAVGETADKIRNETIAHMRELHDPSFGKRLGSAVYDGFEKNGRVIAAPYEKVRVAVSRIAGIDLPKDTKAFYVPNEDYAVLITDNIKDGAQVESLFAHEFAVHAGLFQSIGKKEYVSLMNQVKQAMNKDGHIFNQIRRKYDTQDPEEVFAHAAEDGALPDGLTSKLKGVFNRALGRQGYHAKFTQEDIQNILRKQSVEQRRAEDGFYYNEDGSTAFAGMRFSRDNLLNPHLWEDIYTLEPEITKDTQNALPSFLRGIGKWMDNSRFAATPFGLMLNSMSNTARKYAPQLFADARGRGMGYVKTLTAEEQKEAIIRRLSVPYLEMADARLAWILENKHIPTRSAQLAFDKMVTMHYNAKYGGNRACVLGDVPPEVERAAEALHRYREEQIALGKESTRMFGALNDDLIDVKWYEVDHELWRTVDTDARHRFFARYNKIEDAKKDLSEYYRTYAKRDVIREKLLREIRMENSRIDDKNAMRAERGLEPLEKKEEFVSEQEIEDWLEARIPTAVEHALAADLDPLAAKNIKELGNLSFLQSRIPMDTSGVMKFNAGTPNEFDFSFDEQLRSFDLDNIMQKNMQRFAGEIAVKNVFGTEKKLQDFFAHVKTELEASVAHGDANAGVLNDLAKIKESIAELRGQRPREDALTRMGIVARLFQNISYAKNGANMGFSQLGEIGGAIGYGGAARIFGAVPMLRDLVQDIKLGKVTAEAYRDAEKYMFGRALEAEIWGSSYADRVARDALTEQGSLVNKGLIFASDITKNLGKVTSTLNMLPKMTDSMYRDMRTSYLVDAVDWAAGKEFSKFRNPFSAAKLKASHVTEDMVQRIKDNLNKVVERDKEGRIVSFDMEGWMQRDPESYWKFYGMGETHAQRAIISGMRQGNKNFLKNQNWFTRMLFQFKDYNLRALNAQTMRALTARELDDGIALGMSIATNTAAYALRIGAKAAGMYALGDVTGANDYLKRMFDDGQLLRVAALRSAFSAPASFGNDFYEAAFGAPTIRTTVDRQGGWKKERTDSDIIGDFVSQLPAMKEAFGIPYSAAMSMGHLAGNDATQRDIKALYKALPIPNFIPFMTYIDSVIKGSSYPEKRPK